MVGGVQADSALLFRALQQHTEDHQTPLWAAVHFPRLTLFLQSHHLVWWQGQGEGFERPSSRRRAPSQEQPTLAVSAALGLEGQKGQHTLG